MPHLRKQLDIKENDLWYVVGLIASDGNLSGDGRHLTIVSEHQEYLEDVRRALGLANKLGVVAGANGKKCYRLQFSNVTLYRFLEAIGLTPNKSLTLKNLEIPYWGFADFVRGMIDGDGCIRRWIHPTNGGEQWSLRVYSAASVFAHWIKNAIESWFCVRGRIHPSKTGVFSIKFGKLSAQRIFESCYYSGGLALARKAALAAACLESATSWSRSKTVFAVA